MRFDSASAFYLWILNEVKAVQVNTITNVMQIIPKPGDQQSRSFMAELGIIRVTFSSVHTHSHSVPIFWGRKSSGSQWDRLYLPGLWCAKISNQVGIQIFIYFLSSEWLNGFPLAPWSDRRQHLTYFSVTVTIAPFFFFHSLKMIFFFFSRLYMLSIGGTICLFFILLSGETWQKIAECWEGWLMGAILAAASYYLPVWSERLKNLGDI